ncbi:cell division inhibitor SulA [Xenorhabdus nematophila]|uniref:Cell division inhibitor SulA n=1 Tax=Xenorhabdus nematophila (strain ATCC 19061 / DSM 3370 / CCUG 14189 / LMG 1036 / NCIMB 9965 / AN6) TaxID=406817 RepID=D3VC15_XENNA|nr:SOS-induced cell division inhibitor SulA [Xenorhabdus nematophila]CEF33385.1 Cell division inhibitor SulA [Xenorhabdus nematophila str. Websteri]AYA40666.1 cell division inhibitor SulA [Xenorhabdus nematophila]KHD29505.1 phosphatidate cytidylyltransferase [Xenorhabdus nematophila]MBA0019407.1 cell division inhibitor SulA [Xenorhabdus nematophila]MCB4424690.1 cell division inhibitor SulA [Xenorhabdus nematophila]
MNTQSAWEYFIKQKTATVATTVNEYKTNKEMVERTVKKLPFAEPSHSPSQTTKGMVSELIYNEHQSAIHHILLPLLRQSGNENRWLLWVTPDKKLSRHWLVSSGLPLNKVVQLNQILPTDSIDAMEKALASGNYSVVLGWLPELSEYEVNKLQLAAQKGTALGLIMRPQNLVHQFMPHPNKLQIHSNYYH